MGVARWSEVGQGVCTIFIFSQINKLINLFILYYVPFTITSILDCRYIHTYLGLCQEKNKQKLIKLNVKVYLVLSQINIPKV